MVANWRFIAAYPYETHESYDVSPLARRLSSSSTARILYIIIRLNMGVSKSNGNYPQIIHFNRVFLYKPSILGYPYFWKHPYVRICKK